MADREKHCGSSGRSFSGSRACVFINSSLQENVPIDTGPEKKASLQSDFKRRYSPIELKKKRFSKILNAADRVLDDLISSSDEISFPEDHPNDLEPSFTPFKKSVRESKAKKLFKEIKTQFLLAQNEVCVQKKSISKNHINDILDSIKKLKKSENSKKYTELMIFKFIESEVQALKTCAY